MEGKKSYPTPEARGGGGEELHCVRGKGQQLRGAAKRSYPKSEARGGDQAEQPHVQRAVAA